MRIGEKQRLEARQSCSTERTSALCGRVAPQCCDEARELVIGPLVRGFSNLRLGMSLCMQAGHGRSTRGSGAPDCKMACPARATSVDALSWLLLYTNVNKLKPDTSQRCSTISLSLDCKRKRTDKTVSSCEARLLRFRRRPKRWASHPLDFTILPGRFQA